MSSGPPTIAGKPVPEALLRKLPFLGVLELLQTENVLAIMPYHIEVQ